MYECKSLKVISYNSSKIIMIITIMMSNRATITPTTGLLYYYTATVVCTWLLGWFDYYTINTSGDNKK